MSDRIGVVGLGEAGLAVARGLVGAGGDVRAYDVRLADQVDGAGLRAAADDAGVGLASDLGDLVAHSQVVLSLVTADAALAVAEGLAAHAGPGQIIADANSLSPSRARRVAETLAPTGAAVADVAVMAAVPTHGHRVPMLASGPGAPALAELGFETDVTVVEGGPGAASAIKMLRSLVIKGLEALLLEFAVAADRLGATERVLASLDTALPARDWTQLTTYLVSRTARHARRRSHEAEQVAEMLAEVDLDPLCAAAAARRLAWAADRGVQEAFADRDPRDLGDVLTQLTKERP